MEIRNLYLRETHQYNDGWSHLDRWTTLGKIKVLAFKRVHTPATDQDSTTQWKTTVIGLKGVAPKIAARALYDHFGTSDCRHEYDCCGCQITRPSIKQVKSGCWQVKLNISRNY